MSRKRLGTLVIENLQQLYPLVINQSINQHINQYLFNQVKITHLKSK